ncbi:hypothetical protein DRN74_00095 [Candidatus Micrarchaeota archaeon]|nr:MAG: hypothetical protein DRN74_00095 [Candidatus Micrarchaeota archaeon]
MKELEDIREFYKIMSPRLTVLVTTMDARGVADVAAFSFVTPISFDPPMLLLAVGPNKHSYWSITTKKEFVVNVPSEELAEKIMIAGEPFDPKASKIERAGFETIPSKVVGPPSIKDCVANIECYVEDARKYGDHVIIVGKVVAVRVRDDAVDEEYRLRTDKIRPPLHISDNVFAFPYVEKKIE